MRRKKWYFLMGLCLTAVFVVSFSSLPACAWPDKPITAYVGWSAGGSSDVTTRATALEMEKILKQKILVTNVNGALGSISAKQVSQAPADGYLWKGGAAVDGTWPVLGHAKISWNDFYPFLSCFFPTTIYVKADAPWKNLDELLADIKSKPKGTFKVGHPGAGSNGAIFAGKLVEAAGLPSDYVKTVPYKGGREAGRYLLSGDVDLASVTMADLNDWASAGRIRPVANLFSKDIHFGGVTYPATSLKFPMLKAYEAINPYFGIYIRRDTPPAIVTKIAKAFAKAIKTPSFKKTVVDGRAAILAPLVGQAADEQMSKIESARGWSLFVLGIAKNDPAKFGIPKPEAWSWPPHDRARKAKPWPKEVEDLFKTMQ